jgi:hypothetical protein
VPCNLSEGPHDRTGFQDTALVADPGLGADGRAGRVCAGVSLPFRIGEYGLFVCTTAMKIRKRSSTSPRPSKFGAIEINAASLGIIESESVPKAPSGRHNIAWGVSPRLTNPGAPFTPALASPPLEKPAPGCGASWVGVASSDPGADTPGSMMPPPFAAIFPGEFF